MRRRSKTSVFLHFIFLCLFLLGTSPCVLCPSVANANQITKHDCCPDGDKDIPLQTDDSCCVISGYCVVATMPALQADLLVKVKIDFTPLIGFAYILGFDTSYSPLNSLTPLSTSPPFLAPPPSRRFALLQQFLI